MAHSGTHTTVTPAAWALIQAAIAEELCVDVSAIAPSTRLVEDLKVDSLSLAGVLVALDDFFDSPPEASAVQRVNTVGDLLDLVDAP
jgi:acyl carrier protein